MSWTLFIDESGQDQHESPYEVLAGVAVEDRKLWPLIRQLSDAQQHHFGMRLFEAYGAEAKAKKLLKRKVFKIADSGPALGQVERTALAREILLDGGAGGHDRLVALSQAKIAYCEHALRICRGWGVKAFASIVPKDAPRPPRTEVLRKDYAYLFERFFYFLNGMADTPMGYLVFDELDKSASHVLLQQVSAYFVRTRNGRTRSRLIIPEPFFVHSDLTSMIQMADLIAYTIGWGLRLPGMSEPARQELAPIVSAVRDLQFHQQTEGGRNHHGFKLIANLTAAFEA